MATPPRRWLPFVLGALGLAGLLAFLVLESDGADTAGLELKVEVTSRTPGLGPDRFRFDQTLELRSSPPPRGGAPRCLVALDRSGGLLGVPRELPATLTADALSGSAFGPVWVAALDPPAGGRCDQLAAQLRSIKGAERPITALREATPGWQLGVRQVFIHDKLTD